MLLTGLTGKKRVGGPLSWFNCSWQLSATVAWSFLSIYTSVRKSKPYVLA